MSYATDVESAPNGPSPNVHNRDEGNVASSGASHQDDINISDTTTDPQEEDVKPPSFTESLTPPDEGRPSKQPRDFKDRLKVAFGLMDKNSPVLRWGKTLPSQVKPLHEFPIGYSKLAALQDLDPNFLMFRRYGWLHNRLLANYQDRLAALEYELNDLDDFDKDHNPKALRCRRKDGEHGERARRAKLLEEIAGLLKQYDKLLLRTQQLAAIRTPSRRDQQSVYNFIHGTGAQVQIEAEWIQERDDLVALGPEQEQSWLNGAMEDTFRTLSRTLTSFLFRTKEQNWRTGNENVFLVSQKRFNYVIHSVVTALATLMLLLPIAILSEIDISQISQIAVILSFTLLFAFCCGIFTRARRQEVFAATAAYCAVLVVFIANQSNNVHVVFALENGTVINTSTTTTSRRLF